MIICKFRITWIAFLGLSIAACSGGGGGSPATPEPGPGQGPQNNPPPASVSKSYKFYIGDGLIAVDPDDITTLKVVDSSANTIHKTIYQWTLAADGKTISSIQTAGVFYEAYNHFFFVGNDLVKKQVGTDLTEEGVCNISDYAAAANVDDVSLVYTLAGPDRKCGTSADNRVRRVVMGMGAAGVPWFAKEPITATYDDSGVHNGWLVSTTGGLFRYSPDFSSSVKMISSTPGDYTMEGSAGISRTILSTGLELRIYTNSNATLSAPFHTGVMESSLYDAKNDALYFRDGFDLYRTTFSGGINTVKVAAGFVGIDPAYIRDEYLANSDAYIGFAFEAVDTDQIPFTTVKLLNKDTLAVTTPIAAEPSKLQSFMTGGTRFYFSLIPNDVDMKPRAAVLVAGATAPSYIESAYWSGASYADKDVSEKLEIHRLVLTKDMQSRESAAGATLVSYDPVAYTAMATLGLVPPDIVRVTVAEFGTRVLALGTGFGNGIPFQSDIFFVDLNETDSLRRITTTDSRIEIPYGIFR